MEATVTIICGMILALGQGWLNLRLKQQDDTRDAAREEARQNAQRIAAQTDNQLEEIHLLVNTRLDEALERVRGLETKLGLAAGGANPCSPNRHKGGRSE